MKNIKQLEKDGIPIHFPTDENGLTGRECPNPDCEGYFKIKFGTGLKGENLPCHCPYCGFTETQDKFFTKEQVEHINSIAMNAIMKAFHKDLKKFEFEHKPKGAFGIGISLKVQPMQNIPVHKYCEKELETEIICDNCTLNYAVYGVFAVCPDCGSHNALQIFNKNMEIVLKMTQMASSSPAEISEKLLENALEDCISAFDGFGREICTLLSKRGEGKGDKIKFQNIIVARDNFEKEFKIDFSSAIANEQWNSLCKGFQKRHLYAHKMGVIDSEYKEKSGDSQAIIGRKASITKSEVEGTAASLNLIAGFLSKQITKTS